MTSNIQELQVVSDSLEENADNTEAKFWHKKVSASMKGIHNVDKLCITLPGLKFMGGTRLSEDMRLTDPLYDVNCTIGSIEIILPFCWAGARLSRQEHWVSPV